MQGASSVISESMMMRVEKEGYIYQLCVLAEMLKTISRYTGCKYFNLLYEVHVTTEISPVCLLCPLTLTLSRLQFGVGWQEGTPMFFARRYAVLC